jgi:uncharacterized protein (DUF952 family)
MASCERIFKLCSAAELAQFKKDGKICSWLDNKDGFIHLSDRTSAPVVAKLFFAEAQDLKLLELDVLLPGTVTWVVGTMDDQPPKIPEGPGKLTIHYLLPDGCVHVYGDDGVACSAIMREADVPLDPATGVHSFPAWL